MQEIMHSKYIAPFVGYLSHEECKETGSTFEIMGGYISKIRWERSAGLTFDLDEDFTIENVEKYWNKVVDFSKPEYPNDII